MPMHVLAHTSALTRARAFNAAGVSHDAAGVFRGAELNTRDAAYVFRDMRGHLATLCIAAHEITTPANTHASPTRTHLRNTNITRVASISPTRLLVRQRDSSILQRAHRSKAQALKSRTPRQAWQHGVAVYPRLRAETF
jgi:hypothetical protein